MGTALVGTALVLASHATLGAAPRRGHLAFGGRVGPLGWAAVALIAAGRRLMAAGR